MGKAIVAKNGNDEIMTQTELGARIIDHFQPKGKILEPCIGNGQGFYHYLLDNGYDVDWCEISFCDCEVMCRVETRDFLDYDDKVDWIITNPPFSKIREFLYHACEIADNIVFLCLLPNVFYKKRLAIIKDFGFSIKELIFLPNQEGFPKFGFQLGVVHYSKEDLDSIKITDWR